MRTTISLASAAALAAALTFTACTSNATAPQNDPGAPLDKVTTGSIWSDGELFRTNGTPATFSAGQGNFDELYNTGGNGTFADGVAAISESKPGDQDYNGGRWHVNLLNDDVSPTKYEDATSVDDLDLDDFHSTDTYFECPLRPDRGNGHN